jgi:thymidylate synthase (FAD)
MNLITPSFEIWEQGTSSPVEDMWKHIARCTRVCYQSTPKNNGETDEEFVKRVILRPDSSTGELNFDKIHGAMLEHGAIYLIAPAQSSVTMCYASNKYSKIFVIGDKAYITTNLRVIYEYGFISDLEHAVLPTEYHPKRVTVCFTTNIGVSREFNRHRVNSIAEESTRYCNYTLDKFGNHITYVTPSWLLDSMPANTEQYEQLALDNIIKQYGTENEHNWEDIDYYLFSLMVSNYCYNNLILKGWKPQQAREVLPLATKTQLIHTAFVDDWKHFFALRADGVSGPPHPNAALLAKPLKEEFIKHGYI